MGGMGGALPRGRELAAAGCLRPLPDPSQLWVAYTITLCRHCCWTTQPSLLSILSRLSLRSFLLPAGMGMGGGMMGGMGGEVDCLPPIYFLLCLPSCCCQGWAWDGRYMYDGRHGLHGRSRAGDLSRDQRGRRLPLQAALL